MSPVVHGGDAAKVASQLGMPAPRELRASDAGPGADASPAELRSGGRGARRAGSVRAGWKRDRV